MWLHESHHPDLNAHGSHILPGIPHKACTAPSCIHKLLMWLREFLCPHLNAHGSHITTGIGYEACVASRRIWDGFIWDGLM